MDEVERVLRLVDLEEEDGNSDKNEEGEGISAHPLLPTELRLLTGLQLTGPAGIPNANVNEVAPMKVKDIILDFIVPPRSPDAPPAIVLPSGLGNGVDGAFKGRELVRSEIFALKLS